MRHFKIQTRVIYDTHVPQGLKSSYIFLSIIQAYSNHLVDVISREAISSTCVDSNVVKHEFNVPRPLGCTEHSKIKQKYRSE